MLMNSQDVFRGKEKQYSNDLVGSCEKAFRKGGYDVQALRKFLDNLAIRSSWTEDVDPDFPRGKKADIVLESLDKDDGSGWLFNAVAAFVTVAGIVVELAGNATGISLFSVEIAVLWFAACFLAWIAVVGRGKNRRRKLREALLIIKAEEELEQLQDASSPVEC